MSFTPISLPPGPHPDWQSDSVLFPFALMIEARPNPALPEPQGLQFKNPKFECRNPKQIRIFKIENF
jgi:hypothetical protein